MTLSYVLDLFEFQSVLEKQRYLNQNNPLTAYRASIQLDPHAHVFEVSYWSDANMTGPDNVA